MDQGVSIRCQHRDADLFAALGATDVDLAPSPGVPLCAAQTACTETAPHRWGYPRYGPCRTADSAENWLLT